MHMSNNTETKIVNAMRNSKGRFFSLETKRGQVFNAQFSYETPSTVVIYDRNNFLHRRLNKSSLARFGMGQVQLA
jgi:hypothetical protein